ncbi:MAG: hypothetical protein HY921_12355 [Elusimicrobia bacterium]|nr:hypothetical protein [Elusimicrobiota bacterium]
MTGGPAALQASPARAFSARIISTKQETPGVKTFRLEVPRDFQFIPGMWVMLRLPGRPKPSRAYSLASSPFERGAVEISFNQVGEFTRKLSGLKAGDRVELQGPYGKWRYSDEARHGVLISGGTGITPFRSICRYALERGLPNKLSLFYSSKTPADILYREELEEFRRKGVQVYLTITRPEDMGPGDNWTGPTGRLDVAVLSKQIADLAEADYFLCGPVSLVEGFTKALLEKGIPRDRIHYEKWGDY